jgi:hypothetical protein
LGFESLHLNCSVCVCVFVVIYICLLFS